MRVLDDATPREDAPRSELLEASGIHKTYGGGTSAVHALRGVDVRLRKGEAVAVMGPSGCGKTTLLHILGGIESADAGEVRVNGVRFPYDARALTEIRRHTICFVFQGFGLIPSLSARENVEFPLTVAGLRSPERRQRALHALADVGLADWQHHLPEELSGGERQRVAIARALVPEPEIILADEPTGNLDSATGNEMLDLLLTAARGRGCAIIIVTHDTEAAARADRIVRLRDGRMERDPDSENQP